THVALLDNYRKNAFTLAEILITLGVIGIVAALTLPSLLTNIQNKGYVEGLKKTYSVLQAATTSIVYEEGSPDTWPIYTDSDDSGIDYILDLYRKHLNPYCSGNIALYWGDQTFCNGIKIPDYRDLSGKETAKGLTRTSLFIYSYPFILNDGTIVGIHFFNRPTIWGSPDITFVVDVNGIKGPNKLGRDVFFLYMNKKDKSGKILPYTDVIIGNGAQIDHRDTCDRDKPGYSCAYRVITEGKMNY
ncbi:MAG: type II secretion system protein, partial [Candidatus Gastranaerophilaceae bacterium]